MTFSICRCFHRVIHRIIVPLEASCRCPRYFSVKLCEVGTLEEPKDTTHTYQTGQFFLHKIFCYRGVILFPWMAKVTERDPSRSPDDKTASTDQTTSGKETKSKKHPYYCVLMDGRDSPHTTIAEGLLHLGDVGNYKGHYPIKGIDFVAHEDILPYTNRETIPVEHELFDKLFMPDPTSSHLFTARKVFVEWQKKSFPWPCSWKVYKDTTENIRVTVIPFYMGYRKPDQSHWWGYFIRLENFGELTVQLIDRQWKLFSAPSKAVFTFRAPGVNGQNPILSRASPAFQYSSHVSIQFSSGHMWGTYTMEREDQSQFECRIPPFSLESHSEDKPAGPTDGLFT